MFTGSDCRLFIEGSYFALLQVGCLEIVWCFYVFDAGSECNPVNCYFKKGQAQGSCEFVLQRKYKWLPEHEAAIRKSFDHKAADGYSNAMYRVRHKLDAGTWIPKEYYDELELKWADENWQAKAQTNSNNRTSSDGSLHTGGSIPTTEHYKRLKNSSDETPTCWDLFEKTHKMKGEASKWVSSKSERIAVNFLKSKDSFKLIQKNQALLLTVNIV